MTNQELIAMTPPLSEIEKLTVKLRANHLWRNWTMLLAMANECTHYECKAKFTVAAAKKEQELNLLWKAHKDLVDETTRGWQ